MQKNVNLLPIDDIRGMDKKKLTKNKDMYELRNVDDDTYILSPFTMLYYNGNFNQYLADNRITLCYLIDESEEEIKEIFKRYIKTYDVNEDGLLELHKDVVITKKVKKRDFTK